MELQTIQKEWTLRSYDVDSEISAWNSSAEEYLYEEKNNFRQDPFLRFMSEKIRFTKDMHTLDIGCGAGAYSAAIAQYVGQADGIDLSPRMIELGNAWAKEHGVDNMHLWERNWHTCDPEEFRGKYDVVFAHTTPAIADFTTLVKMCGASRGCCFFCRPARRSDQIFDELRHIAGLADMRTGDREVAYTFDTLWGLGFAPEVGYEKAVWLPKKTLSEAEAWYINRLKAQCDLMADTEKKIREALRSFAVDGMISERIETTLVNMYWRVDG